MGVNVRDEFIPEDERPFIDHSAAWARAFELPEEDAHTLHMQDLRPDSRPSTDAFIFYVEAKASVWVQPRRGGNAVPPRGVMGEAAQNAAPHEAKPASSASRHEMNINHIAILATGAAIG